MYWSSSSLESIVECPLVHFYSFPLSLSFSLPLFANFNYKSWPQPLKTIVTRFSLNALILIYCLSFFCECVCVCVLQLASYSITICSCNVHYRFTIVSIEPTHTLTLFSYKFCRHGEQISLASNRRHQRTHTKEVEVGGKMFQLKRFELVIQWRWILCIDEVYMWYTIKWMNGELTFTVHVHKCHFKCHFISYEWTLFQLNDNVWDVWFKSLCLPHWRMNKTIVKRTKCNDNSMMWTNSMFVPVERCKIWILFNPP